MLDTMTTTERLRLDAHSNKERNEKLYAKVNFSFRRELKILLGVRINERHMLFSSCDLFEGRSVVGNMSR